MRRFYSNFTSNKINGLKALMRLASRSNDVHFYLWMKHKYDKEVFVINFTTA